MAGVGMAASSWWRRLGRRAPRSDPFAVLELQERLERLSREIVLLEGGGEGFARAHHLRAAITAYDDLLAEAGRLIGVDVAPETLGTDPTVRRVLVEAELQARGWTW